MRAGISSSVAAWSRRPPLPLSRWSLPCPRRCSPTATRRHRRRSRPATRRSARAPWASWPRASGPSYRPRRSSCAPSRLWSGPALRWSSGRDAAERREPAARRRGGVQPEDSAVAEAAAQPAQRAKRDVSRVDGPGDGALGRHGRHLVEEPSLRRGRRRARRRAQHMAAAAASTTRPTISRSQRLVRRPRLRPGRVFERRGRRDGPGRRLVRPEDEQLVPDAVPAGTTRAGLRAGCRRRRPDRRLGTLGGRPAADRWRKVLAAGNANAPPRRGQVDHRGRHQPRHPRAGLDRSGDRSVGRGPVPDPRPVPAERTRVARQQCGCVVEHRRRPGRPDGRPGAVDRQRAAAHRKRGRGMGRQPGPVDKAASAALLLVERRRGVDRRGAADLGPHDGRRRVHRSVEILGNASSRQRGCGSALRRTNLRPRRRRLRRRSRGWSARRRRGAGRRSRRTSSRARARTCSGTTRSSPACG